MPTRIWRHGRPLHDAGVYIATAQNGRQIFVTGHSEYDPETLKGEYDRDVSQGKPINILINYYPNDDPTQPPIVRWRGHANLLFSNWLNYYVYQKHRLNYRMPHFNGMIKAQIALRFFSI